MLINIVYFGLLLLFFCCCCCSFGSLTALLYWTVGWEMGVVKQALEAAGVNWGYFFDHNPFEPHCNSHPNNFLVLPPVSHFNCWSNPNSLSVRTKPKNLHNHWEPLFATVHYWYITIGTFQINFAKVSHNNY